MSTSTKVKRGFVYAGLIIWLVINLFPVYWMFTFSLKDNDEIFGSNIIGLLRGGERILCSVAGAHCRLHCLEILANTYPQLPFRIDSLEIELCSLNL